MNRVTWIFLLPAVTLVGTGRVGFAQTIATGYYHSLSVCADGTVRAWGSGTNGKLGVGNQTTSATPVQVSGITNATAVAGGYEHSLAVLSDGTVRAWGDNEYGRLGDGTTVDRWTPVAVSGLTGMTKVAAGWEHSLALKNDGTVWAWGNNINGQLGDGTTVNRLTPVQVSGLTGVIAIASGAYNSYALRSNNTVWAWGRNNNGQVGDGTTVRRLTPVQVSTISNITAIGGNGGDHGLALRNDGTVWAWGQNWAGQVGDGTWTNRLSPVQVSGLTSVIYVAGGYQHSLAVRSDGTVRAWGDNWGGQLGDGTQNTSNVPVTVTGLANVTAVAGGGYFSLSLRNDGTEWAWGENVVGQLGDGTFNDNWNAVQVIGLCSALPLNLLSFTAAPAEGKILLQWQTAFEINNDYFAVEQSLDGIEFTSIGTVKGAGNSVTARYYEFTDTYYLLLSTQYPIPNTIYYRLKQVDYNSSHTYSETAKVNVKVKEVLSVLDIRSHEGFARIRFTTPSAGTAGYEILDASGRTVLSCDLGRMMEGIYTVNIPTSSLPAGIYGIVLRSGQAAVIGRVALY